MTTVETQEQLHSQETEMAVIGCALNNVSALNVAMENLETNHFHFTENKTVFGVMKTLWREGKAVDTQIVALDLKNKGKLDDVGGIPYLTNLSSCVGLTTNIEDYCEIVKNYSLQRTIIKASTEAINKALDSKNTPKEILKDIENTVKEAQQQLFYKIPLKPISQRLEDEESFLKLHRGKDLIGLRVETIKHFNENMLGLRGLILLAAAPNVGKTALTIQLALEVLKKNEDACLVYVSLEMSEADIFRRMIMNLAQTNYKNLVLGEKNQQALVNGTPSFLSAETSKKISEAHSTLEAFGNRLQIIDQTTVPKISSDVVVRYAEKVKEETRSKRVFIVVDYLQVWPLPEQSRLNELEAGKWQIGEMKKIRDALNNDPVMVISEARKPSGKEEAWGGDMADVMGTARGTYTPDVVLLFSPMKEREITSFKEAGYITFNTETNKYIKELNEKGLSPSLLKAVKVRDGMSRFEAPLLFHYKQNRFEMLSEANKIIKK